MTSSSIIALNEDTLKEGDILDGSGNENHGLLNGSNLKIVEGKANDGMEFPRAASDYIAVRNVIIIPTYFRNCRSRYGLRQRKEV